MSSLLVNFFGASPKIRVLDFLAEGLGFDYAKTQIAREAGVSRATLDKLWPSLVRDRIVVKTRRMGRAELYQLNARNPDVKAFLQLDVALAKAHAHAAFEKETSAHHVLALA